MKHDAMRTFLTGALPSLMVKVSSASRLFTTFPQLKYGSQLKARSPIMVGGLVQADED